MIGIISKCTNKPKLTIATAITLSEAEGNAKALVFSSNVSWNVTVRYKDSGKDEWNIIKKSV